MDGRGRSAGPVTSPSRTRQERVSASSTSGSAVPQRHSLTGVIENIVAGLVALALVAYLVYALVRPDRF